MINFLQGKKTYIVAALAAVVYAAELLGYVSAGTANAVFGFLGIGAVVTVRSAIAQLGAPKNP